MRIPFKQCHAQACLASENKTVVLSCKVTTGTPPEAQAGSCAEDHLTLCLTAGVHPSSIATSRAAGTLHRARLHS